MFRFLIFLVLIGRVVVGRDPVPAVVESGKLPNSGLIVVGAGPMHLKLPTENQAIFSDKPENFYQVVQRTFEGVVSYPWEGGKYGFVRTPVRTERGLVYKQFHEGLDIKPVNRDASGEPLDEVCTMADGLVVHVSDNPRESNYGRYVVVCHNWGDGPIYSLYAHLANVVVQVGSRVASGDILGRMGYTGAGINKERAHTHVELNLMLSTRFNEWISGGKSENLGNEPIALNKQGLFHGFNLVGMDLATVLKACRSGVRVSIPALLAGMKPYYRVIVPRRGELEIVQRYPWLRRGGQEDSPSWEISCAGSGLPLSVVASQVRVSEPNVSEVVNSVVPHFYRTRGHLTGSGQM